MTSTIIEDFERILASPTEAGEEKLDILGNFGTFRLLCQEFQSEFLGSGQNYVDIIVEEGHFLGAFGYFTANAEEMATWVRIPLGHFEGQECATVSPVSLFEYFSQIVKKDREITLNFIRLIDAEITQFILSSWDQLIGDSSKKVPLETCFEILSKLTIGISRDQIQQYPEPPLFDGVRRIISAYEDLPQKFGGLILKRMLPRDSQILLLEFSAGIFIFRMGKNRNQVIISLDPTMQVRPTDGETYPEFLRNIKIKHATKNVVYYNMPVFARFCNQVVTGEIPPSAERFNALGQRVLDLIRQYGINWFSNPSPLATKDWARLLVRLLGINFNLRNLSYWFLPYAWNIGFVQFTGGAGNILLLRAGWNGKLPSYFDAYKVQIEKNAVKKAQSVDAILQAKIQEIFRTKKEVPEFIAKLFHVARADITDLQGVLFISEEFEILLARFFKAVMHLSLFSLGRIISAMKKSYNLYLYPKPAWYRYVTHTGSFRIMRWISKLGFDSHEF